MSISKALILTAILTILTRPNCVKNDPCDAMKMREMRGEVGKKTPKKEMDNPSF